MKNNKIKIITLVAGLGSRLSNYDKKNSIKPLKKIFRKSIIEWSLQSYHTMITNNLIKKDDLYFIILKKHDEMFLISKKLKKIFGKKIKIIKIDKLTRGPAETAMLSIKKNKILQNSMIIINDCDHYFNSNTFLNYLLKILNNNIKNPYIGIINVAKPLTTKPEWSYLKLDRNLKLRGIVEKDKKLAKLKKNGVIGSYFFFKGKIFLDEAIKIIKKNKFNIQKEFYISSVLDSLVKKGKKFLISNSPYAFPLGTIKQIVKFKNFYLTNKNILYPEPKTFLFDLDGVLVKHDKGYHSKIGKYTYPLKFIKKNILFLRHQYEKGNKIFITTARSSFEYNKLNFFLNSFNIPFHKLICDFSGGTRILINDKKPTIKNYPTALAITNFRNKAINYKLND